jgi:hypothetical protein
MSTNNVNIIGVEAEWDNKFNIIDPTAFFKKDNRYYLMTCETEYAWHISNQAGCVCLYTVAFS